jgi:hypothetical protein
LDARAIKVHESTIINIATIWCVYEEDVHGWHLLRDAAKKNGDSQEMKEFSIRANHSAWVCKVLMARLNFRGCNHEPYPNAHIWSFSMLALDTKE